MSVMVASVVKKLGIMHLVLGHETYKATSSIITQTLGRIIDIPITLGKVVCHMVFLVVDIDSYDFLKLDFLMKIGSMVDVEKGVIQVRNGLGMVVEVLPLNVVNMLQRIGETTKASVEMMNNNFNNIQLEEKFLEGGKIIPIQSIHLGFEDCNDDSMTKEGLCESKEEEGCNHLWVLPMDNIQYEQLSDHGMNQLVDGKVPMQMLNLVLQEQQQKLLEGQYTKDDDYADWI